MSKSGFYKLMAFAIAVVIFVVVYRLLTVTPRTSESLHKLNQSKQERNVKLNAGETNNNSLPDTLQNHIEQITQETLAAEQTEEENALNSQVEQVIEEIKPHKYSEDPYIEAYSLIYEVFICSKEYDDDKQFFADLDNSGLDKFLKKARENCNEVRTRYPYFTSFSNSYEVVKEITPTTAAGRTIKDISPNNLVGLQKRDQINNRLKHVLQSKIGFLIAEAATMSFVYFQEGEALPVSQWLNSQDTEYNLRTTRLALSTLSCRHQASIACQPVSSQMIIYCFNDNTNCGLDFDSYYKKNVMPGMQKDVDILIEKFEAMSEKQ